MRRRPLRVQMSDRQRPPPVLRLWSRASASKLVSHVASSHPPYLRRMVSAPKNANAAVVGRARLRNLTNALLYIRFSFILMNDFGVIFRNNETRVLQRQC